MCVTHTPFNMCMFSSLCIAKKFRNPPLKIPPIDIEFPPISTTLYHVTNNKNLKSHKTFNTSVESCILSTQ